MSDIWRELRAYGADAMDGGWLKRHRAVYVSEMKDCGRGYEVTLRDDRDGEQRRYLVGDDFRVKAVLL